MKMICLFLLIATLTANASTPAQLFFIQRSKNKNEVHYELNIDDNCVPQTNKPVHGYWKDLEKGPGVTSEIGTFEYIAYGISDQKIDGEWVHFKMKAIQDRNFKAKSFKKDKLCQAEAWTNINGKEAQLTKVYIFAVEGLFKPTVKYIDLFGKLPSGEDVKERIEY